MWWACKLGFGDVGGPASLVLVAKAGYIAHVKRRNKGLIERMAWMILAGFGWFWLALVGFDWFWLILVGFGWLWLVLVGFGSEVGKTLAGRFGMVLSARL